MTQISPQPLSALPQILSHGHWKRRFSSCSTGHRPARTRRYASASSNHASVFCSLINTAAPVANYVPYVITGTDVHRVSFTCFSRPFSLSTLWLQLLKFINNLTHHSLLPQIFAHGTYPSGNLLFISGQLCSVDGKVPDHHKGKVGTSEGCVTQEEAWVSAFGWTIFEIISLFSSTVTRPQRHAASIFSLRSFSLCF